MGGALGPGVKVTTDEAPTDSELVHAAGGATVADVDKRHDVEHVSVVVAY